MGWKLVRTGCDRYEWFEEETGEKVIRPEEVGHSNEPIPVEIPERVPVEVDR